jgi:uncharacterized protein (TIGR03382 family)
MNLRNFLRSSSFRRRLVGLGLFLFGVSLAILWAPGSAVAYQLYTTENDVNLPLRWFSDTVRFEVSETSAQGIETAALITLAQQGLGAWEDATKCTPNIVFSGTTTDKDGSFEVSCDNNNVVVFILDTDQWAGKGFSYLEIAKTTLMISEENGEIVDADIELNAGGFIFSTGNPNNQTIDLLNTLTHEAGHFLGMDHSSDKAATMYAHAPPEETTKRSLEQDDIDGACALYKGFSPAQLDAVSYYEGACGDQDAVAHTDSQNTPPPDPPVVRVTHGCSALPRSATSGVVAILVLLLLSVVQRRRRLVPSLSLELRDDTLGTPP